MKATIRGINSEAAARAAYENGDRSNFTANVMMDVIAEGVEFDKYTQRDDVEINGRMDGFYNDNNGTVHIFEMKNGKRFDEKYQAQVNRYAYQVSATVDFHTAITYVIYQNSEEVTVEVNAVEDVKANFFNTKENAEGRSWARIAASKPGYKESRRAKYQAKRDAMSADEKQAVNDAVNAKFRGMSDIEKRAMYDRKKVNRDNNPNSKAQTAAAAKRYKDSRTEEQKEERRAKDRARPVSAEQRAKKKAQVQARNAAMTPEQVAAKKAAAKIYMANYKAKPKTPEQKAKAKAARIAKREMAK